ncbi:MAG: hypothetical protein AB1609_12410, partial [Bacillota bacterium]
LAGEAPFMPREREIAGMLLDFFLLERALRELADDLDNRPDQVGVALQGILQQVRGGAGAREERD